MDKKFDLEAALAGKPVQTRGGIKVLEISQLKTPGLPYPLRAVVQYGDGRIETNTYTSDGRMYSSSYQDNAYDLVMAPIIKLRFFNLLRDSQGKVYAGNTLYLTAEIATEAAHKTQMVVIKAGVPIEYEE